MEWFGWILPDPIGPFKCGGRDVPIGDVGQRSTNFDATGQDSMMG